MDKRRVTTVLGKYLDNPIVTAAVALRLAPRATRFWKRPVASLASRDVLRSETGLTATSSGWLPSATPSGMHLTVSSVTSGNDSWALLAHPMFTK